MSASYAKAAKPNSKSIPASAVKVEKVFKPKAEKPKAKELPPVEDASASDEIVLYNKILGTSCEDWLTHRKGKATKEVLFAEFKAWKTSNVNNLYCGKGQKTVKFNLDEMGIAKIMIKNLPDSVESWDIREVMSAFTPILSVYRKTYKDKDDGKIKFGGYYVVTIPGVFNGCSISDVIMDLRQGPVLIEGKPLEFQIFIDKRRGGGAGGDADYDGQ
jgi:hypothetical protein